MVCRSNVYLLADRCVSRLSISLNNKNCALSLTSIDCEIEENKTYFITLFVDFVLIIWFEIDFKTRECRLILSYLMPGEKASFWRASVPVVADPEGIQLSFWTLGNASILTNKRWIWTIWNSKWQLLIQKNAVIGLDSLSQSIICITFWMCFQTKKTASFRRVCKHETAKWFSKTRK